jgi:SAM-dependent methyltransferase
MSDLPADRETPRRALGRMIGGFHTTALIGVAARLGLADLLGEGSRHSEELAPRLGAHAPSLRRLMRALVEIGVLSEAGDGRFSLTPLGRLLREDAPGSLRSVAIVYSESFYHAWGALLHSVQTGETAFEAVLGAPFFDYFARHPDEGEAFDRTMAGLGVEIAAQTVSAYDFSRFGRVVDVGGGQGTLIAALLKTNPRVTGVLFDLSAVVAGARSRMEAQGLLDRCELVAGDFFEAVPPGGDAYLLKWIIHDWDDERSTRVLRNCREAMAEQSRLLLIETVLPDRIASEPAGAGLDVHMLVLTGGHERTESEYRALLASCGFQLTRIVPTLARSPVFGAAVSLIEAMPVAAL